MKVMLLSLGLCLSFAAMGQADENVKAYHNIMSAHMDKPYLPFQITTLDGKVLNNASIKGKVTFLNFFFMACPPCSAEIGELKKIYARFSKDTTFQFVAVTFDDPKFLPNFLLARGVNYQIASVPPKVGKSMMYGMGYPSSIVIDKHGNVACMVMGKIEEAPIHTYKDIANGNFSLRTDTVTNKIDRLLHER